MIRLQEIELNRWVRISEVQGGNKLAHKLLQMGIVPGTYTRMIRKAPFGGPVLIEVDGMEIALSREIAAKVMVEEE